MKYRFLISSFSLVASLAVADTPQSQFISSVQMAVQESSPQLAERSQRLVMEQFQNTFVMEPQLRGQHFEMRTTGNELVFVLTTNDDMRIPVQRVVSRMIELLNGQVYARGKSAFYRTALTQPYGGFLEVSVDDSHSKVLSIAAQSVPLRDLLKEIKAKVGSFSYLIPGECADKQIDWSFGGPERTEGIPLDLAMTELAHFFGLTSELRNGTYVFTGACSETQVLTHPNNAADIIRHSFVPNQVSALPISHRQVFVPIFPLGN